MNKKYNLDKQIAMMRAYMEATPEQDEHSGNIENYLQSRALHKEEDFKKLTLKQQLSIGFIKNLIKKLGQHLSYTMSLEGSNPRCYEIFDNIKINQFTIDYVNNLYGLEILATVTRNGIPYTLIWLKDFKNQFKNGVYIHE